MCGVLDWLTRTRPKFVAQRRSRPDLAVNFKRNSSDLGQMPDG